MKNFLFWLGHAAVIMFFVGLKMLNMGYYSYLFMGNAILLYLVGSMVNISGTDESLFHGEIDTSTMSEEAKKTITGIVTWRNSKSHSVHYWCGKKSEFIHSSCIKIEDLEVHTLADYERAAAKAKTIYHPGMLYFLTDDEFFPKDKSLMN